MRRIAPFLALMLLACDPTPDDAQRALSSGAEVVQELDEALAPLVSQGAQRCDAETTTREDHLECLEPWTPVRYGVRLARAAAFVGQRAVDTWRLGAGPGWAAFLPIGACVVHGVTLIVSAIRGLGLEVELADAVEWLDGVGAIAASLCDPAAIEAAEGAVR